VPAVACGALAAAARPSVLSHSSTRALDRWLLLLLAAAALQLAPLPRPLIPFLSPAALNVERAFALVPPEGVRPLTIQARDSAAAVLLLAGLFLLFVTARRTFEAGGVRSFARIAAITGLVLAGVALAQHATARGLMYWRYAPGREGPDPFGPFVNRNHFATWAMMAISLSVGYLAAHAAAHPRPAAVNWRRRVLAALDSRAWMLIAASMLLIVATAASLSRSGLIGLAAAGGCSALLMRRHAARARGRQPRRAIYFSLLAAAGTLGVLTEVGPSAIAGRFGASGTALADRLAIWHDTLPMVRDFWLTGTGVGTFQAAMAVYQRSKPEVIFNQAHNHYLQVVAEGGVLVAVPVWLALSALLKAAWQRLQADRSPMYFIRAGAASGLAGVAVQSLWETGLTIPANAALAAILAAIIVHEPSRAASPER
jgi:O-antigen ligase